MKVLKQINLWLATGFGFGYSPIASGTVGCLWGLPMVWCVWTYGGVGVGGQIVFAVIMALIAIPICHGAEAHFGKKDDGRIVADEYMTFPICMIGLPTVPWVMVMCFLTNRFFDILKPPPARQLQVLKGGLGIVIDDVLAMFYSLAVNHGLYWLVISYLRRG